MLLSASEHTRPFLPRWSKTHRRCIPASSLTQYSHPAIRLQERRKRRECILDMTTDTIAMRAAPIDIEIFMHIENQTRIGAVWIMHRAQVAGATITNEGLRAGEVIARQEDQLSRCARGSDSGHGRLHAACPEGHVRDVVWLVHEPEDDVSLVGVVGSYVGPQRGEDVVGWPALSDYIPVEPRVVVDVDYAVCAGGEASLD